ncbi:MAG TPA: class I SAM-dependent methyltransferase [Woeseiaceae bacterium]
MLKRLGKWLFTGNGAIRITPIKRGDGWLAATLPSSFDPARVDVSAVRTRVELTKRLGEQPLWEGYREVKDYPRATTGNRTSQQVQTPEDMGAFYAWLTTQRKPEVIVEFGTAFGISGMFWLSGLESVRQGKLMTYEPNEIWAEIAEKNLQAISERFTLTRGTFEDSAAHTLTEKSVDIALIDAIHTSQFVYAQYEKLKPYLKRDALVLFDDIGFSRDMSQCWQDLSGRPEVLSSYHLGNRVGLVELRLGIESQP